MSNFSELTDRQAYRTRSTTVLLTPCIPILFSTAQLLHHHTNTRAFAVTQRCVTITDDASSLPRSAHGQDEEGAARPIVYPSGVFAPQRLSSTGTTARDRSDVELSEFGRTTAPLHRFGRLQEVVKLAVEDRRPGEAWACADIGAGGPLAFVLVRECRCNSVLCFCYCNRTRGISSALRCSIRVTCESIGYRWHHFPREKKKLRWCQFSLGKICLEPFLVSTSRTPSLPQALCATARSRR